MTCIITISGKPLKLPDGWLGCGYRAECSCDGWQVMANHYIDILESVQKHMAETLKDGAA